MILTKDLHLQPDDVAGLWGNIQGFIDPNYWNPALWKVGSQYSRTYHDNLRDCSYDLVCKIITQLTVGLATQRNISPTHRMKFLSDTTPRNKTPPSFPLPSPDIPADQDQVRWEIQPPHFLQAYRTIASEALCVRLIPPELIEGTKSGSPAKPPQKVECSMAAVELSGPQYVAATGPPPSSPQDVIDHQPVPETKSQKVPDTADCSEVNSSVDISPIVIHDEEHSDSDGASPGKTDDDTTRNLYMNDNESTVDGQSQMQSFVEEEGYNCDYDSHQPCGNVIVCHDSQTDKYWRKDPHENPDFDVGPSISLEIPGEEVLVTEEMITHAEVLCAEEEEADAIAVAAVLNVENAWTDITKRAIRYARLTAIGATSLNLEHLEKVDAEIDHQLLYWQDKKFKVAEAKQALFDARARVIKNNALLAKIKAEAIDDIHSLAAEQQQDLLTNSTASVVPVARPHQNRTRLMSSIHCKLDLKNGKAGRTLGGTGNIRSMPANLHAMSMKSPSNGFSTVGSRISYQTPTRPHRPSTPTTLQGAIPKSPITESSSGSPATTATSGSLSSISQNIRDAMGL